jgi:hypothetical protein
MKRSVLLILILPVIFCTVSNGQISKFVKNVKTNVEKDLLGDKPQNQEQNSEKKTMPEPSCACSQPELIVDLGGNLKVDYSEISITNGDDGSILLLDRATQKYYIAKDGVTKGPYAKGDPALNKYIPNDTENGDDENGPEKKFKEYITKTGDKYTITFQGKKYGPYAIVSQFAVSNSKDKFAAIVTENVMVSQDMAKTMEAEAKNAKTQEEQMALAMKYAQQMQANMNGKSQASTMPVLISNIPDANLDQLAFSSGQLRGDYKFDDILLSRYDGIIDLKGKKVFDTQQAGINTESFFISTDNSKYASYQYGTLTFSDKTKLSDLFNVHWLKADGKTYLAYMYYSPKKNSIMQCRLPF